MAKLAIEIGYSNIRAAIGNGNDYQIVPLGLPGNPYHCPPVGVKTEDGYLFGAPARLCVLTMPENVAFLSDYVHPGMVGEEMMTAFLEFAKTKAGRIFGCAIGSISIADTSANPHSAPVAEFLKKCVERCGCSYQPVKAPLLSIFTSSVNLLPGEKAMVIDLHNHPGVIACGRCGHGAMEPSGYVALPEFALSDCENYIEDKINQALDAGFDPATGDIIREWIRGEMLSVFTQAALENLLAGCDSKLTLPFGAGEVRVGAGEFEEWLTPRLDTVWKQLKTFTDAASFGLRDVRYVLLLGRIFQSDFVKDHIVRHLNEGGVNAGIITYSRPVDEWSPCLSSLKTNVITQSPLSF